MEGEDVGPSTLSIDPLLEECLGQNPLDTRGGGRNFIPSQMLKGRWRASEGVSVFCARARQRIAENWSGEKTKHHFGESLPRRSDYRRVSTISVVSSCGERFKSEVSVADENSASF